MKNTVIIKGNRYGITLVLDDEIPFEQLLEDLTKKLSDAEKFFDSDRQLAISFEGRELSNEELDEVLYIIMNHSKLNIQYVMDCNNEIEATYFDIIQTAKAMEESKQQEDTLTQAISSESEPTASNHNCNGLFYKGTLRSGQTLESNDSIIILGDVNPGATVCANGNIVVIGSLKGAAIAGKNGNKNAFIMALSMKPSCIQIAKTSIRGIDRHWILRTNKDKSMIAMLENDTIQIQQLNRFAISDLIF